MQTEYPLLSDDELLLELNNLKSLCDSINTSNYQSGGLLQCQ